jgi:hypothetical protein
VDRRHGSGRLRHHFALDQGRHICRPITPQAR